MAARAFSYTALDSGGTHRNGVVEAETQEAAIAQLATMGRYVLEIKEGGKGASTSSQVQGRRTRPSRQELALFTRRMADLAMAGLPLDRVLQVVGDQSENLTLKDLAQEVLEDVRAGVPVSQALAKHTKYFNEVFTQTLRAGEASGQFGDVASRLAEFQEKEVARRSQVISALVYPCILASTAVMVVVFLLTFVVPRLSGIFHDLGDDLPLTTKILLGSTDFLTKNWMIVIGSIVGVIVLLRLWISTPVGAEAKDRFLLHAPIVGGVIQKATISRFARVLGTLVYGGVPILEALDIAGLSAGNRVFQKSAIQVEHEVREGRPIAEAMMDAGAFPPVLTHMVAIGEETGDLPKMLSRVSESLDFEVDTGMRRLVAMVEPLIVLVMGVFVGFVVLSVLLPIFQAQTLVK